MSEATPPRGFRRRGLGRGLDALLTSEGAAEEGSPLISLDPRTVAPNPEQPRRAFEPEALAALGDSIKLHGLLHPIVVQRDGDSYSLVAGEGIVAKDADWRAELTPTMRPEAILQTV